MGVLPVLLALQTTTVALDPQATQGVWEGWGTSLCWMGKAYGDRDDLADLFFTTKTVETVGQKLPGLGMNIVRYNVGACSWNEVDGRKMVVGKGIQPFRQMEGFWLDPKSPNPDSKGWDWSLDVKQRAMMQKAKRRGANRFELFSNAPMWWMCANDNPSGAAKGTDDNLRPDQYENFAIYMAAVAKRSKDQWGIAFTTINPFNEPASSWWNANGKQEGCHFSAASQATLLPLLRRELDARGLQSLPIASSDETYVTHAIQTWNHFGAETKALVRQINVHGYEGDKSPRKGLRSAAGDRPMWLSEHGEEDGTGLAMARNLGLDVRDLKPLAWCYWQPLDGGGWGFIDSDVPKATLRKVNPKYFVMAQYTRHIRPGMTILTTDDADTVAAYDPKRRRLVVVAANLGDAETQRTLDLSKFAKLGGKARRWATEPKGAARYEKLSELPVAGKSLVLTLSGSSIQTIEIDGAAP